MNPPAAKQLEVKTNRTSFLYGNRYRHHNTELRMQNKTTWTSLETERVNSGAREG
jgi:hypothetical protein